MILWLDTISQNSPRTHVSGNTSSYVPGISLFAKLLADEAITVRVDPAATTASFQPEHRVLTLPPWQGFDEAAWLLFVSHEVGHAIYTPRDVFHDPDYVALETEYGPGAVLTVWNIVEDVRIERLIQQKYHGLSGIFLRGYRSLLAKSFFGWADTCPPDTWTGYGLWDHLNIYAKVGTLLRLSLTTDEEQRYHSRMMANESHADVMQLVREMMHEIAHIPQSASSNASAPTGSAMGSEDPFASESMTAASTMLDTACRGGDETVVVMPTHTETEYLHANDVDLETSLEAWRARSAERAQLRKMVTMARMNAKPTIATMVSAFRAHQSAWCQQRVQTARTGVIDPTRLSQYQLTDDLFLRRRDVPHAQNHGFVLHVDWSSSMGGKSTMLVLWQVLHLLWFAESINVPVEVYAFGNGGTPTPTFRSYDPTRVGMQSNRLICLYRSDAAPNIRADAQALLLALVLQHCRQFDVGVGTYYEIPADNQIPSELWVIIKLVRSELNSRSGLGIREHLLATTHQHLKQEGTPLFHALVSSVDVVRSFRDRHRVEQCISVWLTDGEDTAGMPISGPTSTGEQARRITNNAQPNENFRGLVLVDPRSGRSIPVQETLILPALFRYHRQLTGATVVCVDLTIRPVDSLARVMTGADLDAVASRVGPVGSESRVRRVYVSANAKRRNKGYTPDWTYEYNPVRGVRPPKQTRSTIILPNANGTFDDTGVLVVAQNTIPTIGADAYLVSHPDWWGATAKFGNTSPVMKRFVNLLVPYMAMGRSDARG